MRSVKYQPLGIRGLAGVRAADYGQSQSLGEYTEVANAETLVVLQIETARAVDHLPEILKVGGIDVVFIGPSDLSQSLGLPGQ
ncbi:MAG: aldolase/citrate lyase family protein, partial [Acidobacteriota bacterium]|nr:aldolase/citrate lyase family protein [Acidobacteriota bacterium]